MFMNLESVYTKQDFNWAATIVFQSRAIRNPNTNQYFKGTSQIQNIYETYTQHRHIYNARKPHKHKRCVVE